MQYRREFVIRKSNERKIRENYIWFHNHNRKETTLRICLLL